MQGFPARCGGAGAQEWLSVLFLASRRPCLRQDVPENRVQVGERIVRPLPASCSPHRQPPLSPPMDAPRHKGDNPAARRGALQRRRWGTEEETTT
jgi:hypothetical protein